MQGSAHVKALGADSTHLRVNLSNWAPSIFLSLAALCLCLACWWLNPFCQVLISNAAPLARLTPGQRANIELAAQSVDGFVLAPGESFSFNRAVGPRTASRGYCQSPSYLDSGTPMTFGGGVCLVSSLLYRTALELGLTIQERKAHTRTVQTIPAGFDATVWTGQSDLRFQNNYDVPLQIKASTDSGTLKVSLLGDREAQGHVHKCILRRMVVPVGDNKVEVTVLREDGSKSTLASRDFYRLPTPLEQVIEVKRQVDKKNAGGNEQH